MDYKDLEVPEIAALVALLQRMVVMDHVITSQERNFVLTLSQQFDPSAYQQAVAMANEKLRDDQGFVDLVELVVRPEAQQFLYTMLVDTAAADEFATGELSLLVWLEEAWGVERHPAVAAEWDTKSDG